MHSLLIAVAQNFTLRRLWILIAGYHQDGGGMIRSNDPEVILFGVYDP